jgi:molybdenum cofactor cytidylyltransferase
VSERIAGIILAAGKSSRMGTAKALLHAGGRTLLESLVEVYSSAPLDPMLVVASGAIAAIAKRWDRVTVVMGDPEQPMIDSIIRAIEALPDSATGAIVQPVDAPFTDPAMIAALLAGGSQRSRVLCHGGRPGHPVLIARSLFPEILERPEHGLREVLSSAEVELVEWPDPRVLADLDSPADLREWQIEGPLH